MDTYFTPSPILDEIRSWRQRIQYVLSRYPEIAPLIETLDQTLSQLTDNSDDPQLMVLLRDCILKIQNSVDNQADTIRSLQVTPLILSSIPQLPPDVLKTEFTNYLKTLRGEQESSLTEPTCHRVFQEIVLTLKSKKHEEWQNYFKRYCDFYLEDEKLCSSDAFNYFLPIVTNHYTGEEREDFMKRLIDLIGSCGQYRSDQKNLSYFFESIFSKNFVLFKFSPQDLEQLNSIINESQVDTELSRSTQFTRDEVNSLREMLNVGGYTQLSEKLLTILTPKEQATILAYLNDSYPSFSTLQRQSVAEMILLHTMVTIDENTDEKIKDTHDKLLCRFFKDENPEVKRVVEIIHDKAAKTEKRRCETLASKVTDQSLSESKAICDSNGELEDSLNLSFKGSVKLPKPSKAELERVALLLEKYRSWQQSDLEALKKFKSSLTPTNCKEKLIEGLNNPSDEIADYSWKQLETRYLYSQTGNSDREKEKWVHIVFDGYKKPYFPLKQDDFIEKLFFKSQAIPALREPLIQSILALLKSETLNLDYEQWLNLMNSASSDVGEDLFHRIAETYSQMILDNPNLPIALKQRMLDNLSDLSGYNEERIPKVMSLLVNISNTNQDQQGLCAGDLIAEQLADIEDLNVLNETFFSSLSEIRGHHHKTIHQVLCFLVHIVAQEGNNEQGIQAIKTMQNLISRLDSPAMAWFTKKQLVDWGIAGLKSLEDLNSSIQSQIEANSAWAAHDRRCDTKTKITASEEALSDDPKHADAVFFKTCLLIQQEKFDQAKAALQKAEEEPLYSSPLPLHILLKDFLEGEIAFGKKHYSEAIGFYNRFLCEYPLYIQAKVRLYEAYQQLDSWSSANEVKKEIHFLSRHLILKEAEKDSALSSQSRLPYEQTIALAAAAIDAFSRSSFALIKQQQANYKEQVKDRLNSLKQQLYDYLGQPLVSDFFKRQEEKPCPWESSLFSYPHQIRYWARDTFNGILHEVVPSCVSRYSFSKENRDRAQKLEQHIKDSRICDVIQEDNLEALIQNHTSSAYKFIEQYAFTDTIRDACALGLSSDISNAYNLLTGLLQLKHWELIYEEVVIEPSGTTEDTHAFMQEVFKREKPIVMFVPVIVQKKPKDNPTLDEIKFLIKKIKEGCQQEIHLVFGAYECLPIFMQVFDPIGQEMSPQRSFENTLDHIVKYYGVSFESEAKRNNDYRQLMDHMLKTRISVNVIANTTTDKERYDQFKTMVKAMFEEGKALNDVLECLFEQLPDVDCPKREETMRWGNVVPMFDALLFTDLLWFNSAYQLLDTKFVEKLKDLASKNLPKLRDFVSWAKQNNFSGIEELEPIPGNIEKFVTYLDRLKGDIEKGLQWQGINNFSVTRPEPKRKDNPDDNALVPLKELNLGDSIPLGLCYQKVPGDDHCFYHAIALYLGTTQEHLREVTANYLDEHREAYQETIRAIITNHPSITSIDEYIKAVKERGEWAGDQEIVALMHHLDRPIVVISPDGQCQNRTHLISEQGSARFSRDPIFVYYNGQNHYDGLTLDGSLNATHIFNSLVSSYPQNEEQPSAIISSLTVQDFSELVYRQLDKAFQAKFGKVDWRAEKKARGQVHKEKLLDALTEHLTDYRDQLSQLSTSDLENQCAKQIAERLMAHNEDNVEVLEEVSEFEIDETPIRQGFKSFHQSQAYRSAQEGASGSSADVGEASSLSEQLSPVLLPAPQALEPDDRDSLIDVKPVGDRQGLLVNEGHEVALPRSPSVSDSESVDPLQASAHAMDMATHLAIFRETMDRRRDDLSDTSGLSYRLSFWHGLARSDTDSASENEQEEVAANEREVLPGMRHR